MISSKHHLHLLSLTLVLLKTGRVSSLLGFGRDLGSCPAPPFRTEPADLAWPEGCPDFAPCCSEYGYCQTRETWELGTIFRDCNGESNGLDLPLRTLQAELAERNAGNEAADDELLGVEGVSLEELVEALEDLQREEAEEAKATEENSINELQSEKDSDRGDKGRNSNKNGN